MAANTAKLSRLSMRNEEKPEKASDDSGPVTRCCATHSGRISLYKNVSFNAVAVLVAHTCHTDSSAHLQIGTSEGAKVGIPLEPIHLDGAILASGREHAGKIQHVMATVHANMALDVSGPMQQLGDRAKTAHMALCSQKNVNTRTHRRRNEQDNTNSGDVP